MTQSDFAVLRFDLIFRSVHDARIANFLTTMVDAMSVSIKRVYETPEPAVGKRVLVDRLWPRGVTKEAAKIDLWLKDVAPSTELRKWYGHDPEKWPEFQGQYRSELEGNPALAELQKLSRKGKVTLVYAAKDENHSHALVLLAILGRGA